MLGKIYTAVAGMIKQDRKIQSTAGNISNISNIGYKRQVLFENEFHTSLYRGATTLTRMNYDFNQGPLRQTDNLTDFAINGDAFFMVRLEDGTFGYTRQGDFKLDNGLVKTRNDDPIMVRNLDTNQLEEFQLASIYDLNINGVGEYNLNGTNYKIEMVTFDNLQGLLYQENNVFLTQQQPIEATEYELIQSYVEQANVDASTEYTELLIANRSLQSNTTAFKTMDEVVEKAIDQVGRS
jgi:flagellar basal-body rod protein FlgG